MPSLRHLPAALAALAGTTGAVLTVLGDTSPVTGGLTLFFLLTAPALATWPLLPRLTPPARAIVSGAMTFVVDMTVAQLMLSLDLWSPRGGVAAVLAVCALPALTALVLTRRAPRTLEPAAPHPEEDDWLFEP